MFYILYETTNLINNKSYIGIHKTKNLNDGYLGSGTALTLAIKKYGKENFKRDIIIFCNNYEELLEIEKFIVNEEWVKNYDNYNLKTGGQSSGILSKESKLKISNTLKEKYRNGTIMPTKRDDYTVDDKMKEKISNTLKERYKYQTHNRKGIEPWNKGLKGVQEGWNKGKTTNPLDEEHKSKISNTLKEKYKTDKHPCVGKTPWNKNLKGVQKAWNKGKTMEKIQCPYCKKNIDIGNAKRWHFDNCKLRN